MKKTIYAILNPFSSIIKLISKFAAILCAIIFFISIFQSQPINNIIIAFLFSALFSMVSFGIDKFMNYLNN